MTFNVILNLNLVVITKYRRKCISEEILEDLKEISKRLLSVKGGNVLEVNGEEDHLHILFECPPQVELAKLVNTFKTVSSRLIRKNILIT
ncbi:MAG: IS200/IS605 family transposase [Cetobacterium somerae]|uniref:IS200/IS605 family transposase n=1 Tax=Cetobacterium somerae TaxID=188913 RepID=UPI003F339380